MHDQMCIGNTCMDLFDGFNGDAVGISQSWKQFGLRGVAVCSNEVNPAIGLIGEAMVAQDLIKNIESIVGR